MIRLTEKVERAAKIAYLDEFILGLKDEYYTIVEGVRLSGVKDKVGLARTFYNSPKILIMDEAQVL